ncbi:MAG: hypothetical protein IEMM0002_0771 [bacterium]|nr:MAG: hypothetical protein IEMM0002_0771 [bacterium]
MPYSTRRCLTPFGAAVAATAVNKVRISLKINYHGTGFVIRDEGEGFDFKKPVNPTVEEKLCNMHGCGVYFMKQLIGEVIRSGTGGVAAAVVKRTE